MSNPAPLKLLVCQHYAEDIHACAEAMGLSQVQVTAFPAKCGCPPLRAADLQLSENPGTEIRLALGGPCLNRLPPGVCGVQSTRLNHCQELLVDRDTLEGYQREGAYVLSSAWLKDWRRHILEWGEDPENVREMMRESARSLLCLDTGRGPDDLEAEMEGLGKALGLPWRIVPVGQNRLQQVLQELVEAESQSTQDDSCHRAADQALALEFMGELSRSLNETEVRARMVSFFTSLFGADQVHLEEQDAALPAEEEFKLLDDGFLVELGHQGKRVAVLVVRSLAFPQHRERYLNLAITVADVCAMAIQNARTYQALAEVHSVQQLMLDVLDAFYRPGGELEELATIRDRLQAFTRADQVEVRLNPEEGLRLGLEAFTRVCEPDPSRSTPGLCGALISGPLPSPLPNTTPRGTFWTNDLEAAMPALASAGLTVGEDNPCMRSGIHSLALVPLLSQTRALGLLLVEFRERGRIRPELLDLLEGVSGSIALGLERRFAEERLKVMNQDLESRVKERTAELAAINESLRREIDLRAHAEAEKAAVEQQLLQAQKLEAIGTLAGGIAHDLNNILTPILGFAEMGLDHTAEGEPLHRPFQLILQAGERARDLVSQILLFSRRQQHERAPILVAPTLKEALKLIRATLPTTIEIRSKVGSPDAKVLANPTELHQIVMNLCTNAAHAMQEQGGVLELRLERVKLEAGDLLASRELAPGNFIVIQVSDTGCGIPKELLPRIFEPFFTTKGPGQGTGLGLSVVHGIVKSCGGHISAYSEPGQGSVFRVYLPLLPATPTTQEKQEPVGELPRGTERILVVEDDELALEATLSALSELGYRATPEVSSLRALERLEEEPLPFDLVITDMTMPKLTGQELIRQLRATRPSLPVILCSGYTQGLLQEQYAELGIQAFIQKPYTIGNLARCIRGILDR